MHTEDSHKEALLETNRYLPNYRKLLFHNFTIIDENFACIPNQDVLVEDGKIKEISTTKTIAVDKKTRKENKLASGIWFSPTDNLVVIEGKGKRVLSPGFVNAHCHVPMVLLRGYGENLNLHDWLYTRIFPYEEVMTTEDMYWGALLGITEMLACGVTSFSEMYMDIPVIAEAAYTAQIKCNICQPGNIKQTEATLELVPQLKAKLKAQNPEINYADASELITVDSGFHAVYTGTPEIVEVSTGLAKKHNLQMQLHLSETAKENEDCQTEHGVSPAEFMVQNGLFATRTTAAHCVHLSATDMTLLKEHNVFPCHCPSSNFKLGSGFADVKAWLEAGLTPCLGTDGAASNNNLNILEELHLAAMLAKGLHRDATCLTTTELMRIATVNGAKAQGRLNTGLIKEGFEADLVVFDLDTPHTQPVFDPLANIIYSAQASNVRLTMVQGRVLYNKGKYFTLNPKQIIRKCLELKAERQAQIAAQGGLPDSIEYSTNRNQAE